MKHIDKCADRAALALAAHSAAAGETEAESQLSDLLTDLIHWTDRQSIDFAKVLKQAQGHYEYEQTGGYNSITNI